MSVWQGVGPGRWTTRLSNGWNALLRVDDAGEWLAELAIIGDVATVHLLRYDESVSSISGEPT